MKLQPLYLIGLLLLFSCTGLLGQINNLDYPGDHKSSASGTLDIIEEGSSANAMIFIADDGFDHDFSREFGKLKAPTIAVPPRFDPVYLQRCTSHAHLFQGFWKGAKNYPEIFTFKTMAKGRISMGFEQKQVTALIKGFANH